MFYWLICKMCYWALRFIYLNCAKISEIWCEPSNPPQWEKDSIHFTPERFLQTGEGNKFVLQSDLGPANFWDQWKNQVPKSRALTQYHPEFILFFNKLWNEFKCTHLLNKYNELFVHTVLWTFHIHMKLMQSSIHIHMLQSKVVVVRTSQAVTVVCLQSQTLLQMIV